MPVPGVISAKDVFITGCRGVQSMKIAKNQPSNSFSHSGVAGGVQTLHGIPEYSWTATGVGADPGLFPLATGATKKFTLSNTTGNKYSFNGSIYTTSLALSIDVANYQNPMTWNASGLFAGAVAPTGTGEADASYYAGIGSAFDIEIDGSSVLHGTSSGVCVQNCTLTFTRPPSPYNCGGVHYINSGNLDASISLGLLESKYDDLPFDAADHEVVITVGDAAAWTINYVQFGGIDGPGGDRNTDTNVSMTVTGKWTGVNSDGDAGSIISPSAVTYWPPA